MAASGHCFRLKWSVCIHIELLEGEHGPSKFGNSHCLKFMENSLHHFLRFGVNKFYIYTAVQFFSELNTDSRRQKGI